MTVETGLFSSGLEAIRLHITLSPRAPRSFQPGAMALYDKFTTALEAALRRGDTEEEHSRRLRFDNE